MPQVEQLRKNQFYTLASIAIVLALLYFGQEVLIPLALAVLVAFVLAPVVSALERLHLGRVASTLLVVLAALTLVCGFGWIVEKRFVEIVTKLPEYRQSMQVKFERLTRPGGLVEQFREEFRRTVQEAPATQAAAATQAAIAATQIAVVAPTTAAASAIAKPPTPEPPAAVVSTLPVIAPPSPDQPLPVRIYPAPASALDFVAEYLSKLLSPVATAGLVVVFIIFILVGRENLRDRMILLAGGGRLHVTTQAFDDAATRIGRFLTAQSVINLSYGAVVALGLWVIDTTMGGGQGGLRTALLAGMICAVMRYIPYIGPWLGAAIPLALAFAAFPGNGVFFVTLAMFVGIEVVVSQAVEPNVLGSSTGVSPIAVLVAAVFWTWLWGPVGLLLSTPLTVLLVVMGKYIPQLAVLDVLLGDKPVLDPPTAIYQRLIAGDDEEAAELAISNLKERSLEQVYDEVLIPVLADAERDWHHGDLDNARHQWIRQGLKEIVQALGDKQQMKDDEATAAAVVRLAKGKDDPATEVGEPPAARPPLAPGKAIKIRCLPAHDEADQIVGLMLAQVLTRRGFEVSVPDEVSLASEMIASIDPHAVDVVVVSALPPKAAIHARYLLKLMSARHPGMRIVVGLWTNNPVTGIELGHVQTVTSLDALQGQLDQLAPVIQLASSQARVNGPPHISQQADPVHAAQR